MDLGDLDFAVLALGYLGFVAIGVLVLWKMVGGAVAADTIIEVHGVILAMEISDNLPWGPKGRHTELPLPG